MENSKYSLEQINSFRKAALIKDIEAAKKATPSNNLQAGLINHHMDRLEQMKAEEVFKVSVQDMDHATPIKGGSFTTKKAAKAFVKEMKAAFDLINHGGYIVNYNKRFELFTNY